MDRLRLNCTKAKLQILKNVKHKLCNSLSYEIINTFILIKLSDPETDFNDGISTKLSTKTIDFRITFILYI